jgi:hypothetical protein
MQDCGLQHRLPGRRLAVGRGVAKHENFRQKQVQRFDSGYLIKAREHSVGQNNDVGELLCLLSLMRSLGDIGPHAQVEWDRAHVQATRGDLASDAAHLLPCQVLVDGNYPWDLVKNLDIQCVEVRAALRGLFGHVYCAPKIVNAADSIAEASCLRGALTRACSEVIESTRPLERTAGVLKRGIGLNYGDIELSTSQLKDSSAGIDIAAVQRAYRTWVGGAKAAFQRAITHAGTEGAGSESLDVTGDVLCILQHYLRFADILPTLFASDATARFAERLWRSQA